MAPPKKAAKNSVTAVRAKEKLKKAGAAKKKAAKEKKRKAAATIARTAAGTEVRRLIKNRNRIWSRR